MDCWHPKFVRADESDSIRQWAELEGKSATMRDDLYQSSLLQPVKRRKLFGFLFVGKLIAAIVESWSHIHSR